MLLPSNIIVKVIVLVCYKSKLNQKIESNVIVIQVNKDLKN